MENKLMDRLKPILLRDRGRKPSRRLKTPCSTYPPQGQGEEDAVKEMILVRHGEADHMVNNLTGGWSDTHLTELGRQQAKLTGISLAALIKGQPFQFYSSDLARAAETAELIAKSLPLQPVFVPELRELNNGAAANCTKEEAAKLEIPITCPTLDWAPYPGAESWGDMSRRVAGFLEKIKEDPHDLTVLVMHGGSGNAAIHWWLRLGINGNSTAYELDPCSISRFSINRWHERTIIKLNDTSHLNALSR